MSDKGCSNNKDVQSHSEVVETLLKGEIERLKEDLDRLHRERDSFQRQCSIMAEENERFERDSKRLTWMIENNGHVEWEFSGNCYVTCFYKNKSIVTLGGDDTRAEIDKAMEMCK